MSNIKIVSNEVFDIMNFQVDDFYNTKFSYELNKLLIYSEGLDVEELNESLHDDDYVKINLMCNDVNYTIYHCFTKNTPVGIITQGLTVLEQIGEKVNKLNLTINDPNVRQIEKWYYEITNNCNDYEDDFWYSPDLYESDEFDKLNEF